MNSSLLLTYQRSIGEIFQRDAEGFGEERPINQWDYSGSACASCSERVTNFSSLVRADLYLWLFRTSHIKHGYCKCGTGVPTHTDAVVAAAECKVFSRPPLSALRPSFKNQSHWVKCIKVWVQSSHTWDNLGLTAVLRMQIKYLTTGSDFQLTTTLHQRSTKSRELLYVFQHPPNVVRYIAASLKGSILLFVSLY